MRITAAVAATALLALAGCESGAPVAENQANAAVEINAAEAPAAADPAALRELLPLYPGATQVRDGRDGGSLAFATADPTRPVIDFYAAATRRAGFAVEEHPPMGIALSMTGTRDGGDLVTVTASRVGNVTEVQAMAALGPR